MDAPQQTLELGQDVPGAFHAAHGSETPLKLERRVATGESCGLVGVGGVLPPVLDACCGARMFWFDKADARAVFVDRRRETFEHVRTDCGNKSITVNPDVLADFSSLPFPDDSFALVVFDPPHKTAMSDEASRGNIIKYYGALFPGWREMLTAGFAECFRVLRPHGTLIFKWCELEIPLDEVLALTPEKPLFGHRVAKRSETHWVAFLKGGGGAELVAKDSCDNPKSQNDKLTHGCP